MSSKKSAFLPATPSMVARVPGRASSGAASVIGADLSLNGDMRADGDVHVEGTVCGDIACAALVLSESGRVEGAITADSARLAGTVLGAVRARELVICKTARIAGDVTYEALTIEQGAGVEGHLRVAGQGTPALQAPEPSEARLSLAQ